MNPLIISTKQDEREAAVSAMLSEIPAPILRFMERAGVRVRLLRQREQYAQASPELVRLKIDVDAWPNPPAGLFVVAEKTLYLRSISRMTVYHELGHGFDAACGSGVYWSGSAAWRSAFHRTTRFVTPYAATATDEAFAEAFRAYFDANDAASSWPDVSRKMLRSVSPAMFAIMAQLIGGIEKTGEVPVVAVEEVA